MPMIDFARIARDRSRPLKARLKALSRLKDAGRVRSVLDDDAEPEIRSAVEDALQFIDLRLRLIACQDRRPALEAEIQALTSRKLLERLPRQGLEDAGFLFGSPIEASLAQELAESRIEELRGESPGLS